MQVSKTPMFVIKVQFQDSDDFYYYTTNVISKIKDIRNNSSYGLNWYCFSKEQARKVYFEAVSLAQTTKSYPSERQLKTISIVELSNYEPFPEHEIFDYREIK